MQNYALPWLNFYSFKYKALKFCKWLIFSSLANGSILTSAHGKLCSPPNSPAHSGTWTESTALWLSVCRAKPVASSGEGIRCTVLPNSGSQTVSSAAHAEPVLLPHQGRETNLQSHLLLNIVIFPALQESWPEKSGKCRAHSPALLRQGTKSTSNCC